MLNPSLSARITFDTAAGARTEGPRKRAFVSLTSRAALTQVRKEARVAIGRLAQNLPVRVHNSVEPLLHGISTLLSPFFACGAELPSDDKTDEGTDGRCHGTHECNHRVACRM